MSRRLFLLLSLLETVIHLEMLFLFLLMTIGTTHSVAWAISLLKLHIWTPWPKMVFI